LSKEINKQLKEARELRGWSQKYVAEQIGVDPIYISRWERGVVQPSSFYRPKLCELFDKNAEELGFLMTKESNNSDETRGEQQSLPSDMLLALSETENSQKEQKKTPNRVYIVLSIGLLAILLLVSGGVISFLLFNHSSKQSTPILRATTANINFSHTYEAEATNNILIGSASTVVYPQFSGGEGVRYLGKGEGVFSGLYGALIFNNIAVPQKATYKLILFYGTFDPRTVYLSVNDGEGIEVTCPSTGDYPIPGSVTIMVQLNQGNNTIKIYNDHAATPDIDKIEIDSQ